MRQSPLRPAAWILLTLHFFSAAAAQSTAPLGQWSPTLAWPLNSKHAHLLPTGKVMFWNVDGPRLWDPVTNTVSAAAAAGVNILCAGHSFLPNGKLLVTGGHISSFVGLRQASAYDAFTNT